MKNEGMLAVRSVTEQANPAVLGMPQEQFDLRRLQAVVNANFWSCGHDTSIVGTKRERRYCSKAAATKSRVSLRLQERHHELGWGNIKISYMLVPQSVRNEHACIRPKCRRHVPTGNITAYFFFLIYHNVGEQREKRTDCRTIIVQKIAILRIAGWRGAGTFPEHSNTARPKVALLRQ